MDRVSGTTQSRHVFTYRLTLYDCRLRHTNQPMQMEARSSSAKENKDNDTPLLASFFHHPMQADYGLQCRLSGLLGTDLTSFICHHARVRSKLQTKLPDNAKLVLSSM